MFFRSLPPLEVFWRILENLGNGKGGVNSFLWGRLQNAPT